MGSSDRRINTRYCYNYFRLGNAFADLSLIERLMSWQSFSANPRAAWWMSLNPNGQNRLHTRYLTKLPWYKRLAKHLLDQVFPFSSLLSPSIDRTIFTASHFVQSRILFVIQCKTETELDVSKCTSGREYSLPSIGEQCFSLAKW